LPDEATLRTSPRGVGADTHRPVVTFATSIRCRETKRRRVSADLSFRRGGAPRHVGARSKHAGWSIGRAAWELGVSIREYREFEAGDRPPNFETWDRICKAFGWPQTFVGADLTGAGQRR
jgi:hypothetical protein